MDTEKKTILTAVAPQYIFVNKIMALGASYCLRPYVLEKATLFG